MSLRYLNTNQLSEMTGKDRRTIKKRLESLEVHSVEGRAQLYDMYEALPILYSHDLKGGLEKRMQEQELRVESAKAEKLELEVARIRGDVVDIDEVVKVVEKEYSYVRSQFRAIPSKLAKPLSMIMDPNEVHLRLQDAVDECLTELTADIKYGQDRLDLLEPVTEAAGDKSKVDVSPSAETQPG